jgi:aspartate/methionine/tyrosine aminotransferase
MKNMPGSLKRVLEKNGKLENTIRGLPNLGSNLVSNNFSPEVKIIYDTFSLYGNDLYVLENEKIKGLESRSLGGGSPMKTLAFPMCKQFLLDTINEDLSEYPMAAGDEKSRKIIFDYLKNEGFKSNNEFDEDNIIFTVSTTQAFNILCEIICRPYDVILMTGPNYGLFTFVPERSAGATVEILPLSEEDDWYVNKKKLSERIDEINNNLKKEYKNKLSYIPKVVAFLNENPHNPLGKVMSEENKEILEGIGDVCLNKGVFVIDDLIYRDLSYDRKKIAKPMASYKKYFDNTITITGLSKAYGLASIRSGMIVANKIIIRAIRNKIFQTMDSSPVLQGRALAGAFNNFKDRKKTYKDYFNPIIKEYLYRLSLLTALIDGINSIHNLELRNQIENDFEKYAGEYNIKLLKEGIPNVTFVNGTIPDSGFFEMLDFSKLKGKKAPSGRIITSEIELLKFLYEEKKIKLILGQSISWPNKSQLVGRVTTALSREELIERFGAMNSCIRELK